MKERLTTDEELNLNYCKIPIEDFNINNDTGREKEIRNLLINKNYLTIDQYRRISQSLIYAVEANEVELIEILLSEEVVSHNAIFKINKSTKTASLFIIINEFDNFILPRSIQYNSENYIVTSIIESEYHKNVKNLQFDENTEIKTIYRNAFKNSSINSLYIPPSLNDLREGWCIDACNLSNIEISPLNKNFQFKDNKFLLGKSDPKSDIFDVLLFAVRNISEAKIPSEIKIISSYSFFHCSHLTKIEIPINSQLQTIEKNAFEFVQFENIFIPEHLSKLNGAFSLGVEGLKKIEISPLNKNFQFKDNKFLLGKSDPKSDIFDVLLFAVRNISEAKIPPEIKIISSYSFFGCYKLNKVEIPINSQLQTIEEFSFTGTSINRIFIPKNVKIIGKNAFEDSDVLEIVEFAKNSKLQIIDNYAFSGTNISEICIPSKVFKLGIGAFYSCPNLKHVEIPRNSKLQSFEKYTFYDTIISQINVPSNVKTICDYAFYSCKQLKNISIPKDSELKSIGIKAFGYTQIESIYFPSKLSELSDGWCFELQTLNKVKISLLNKNFQMINDQIILGKSDLKSDNFDVLLFAVRNISKVKIPSNIKIISSHAFCTCYNLTSVEIPPNSELKIIGDQAFCNTGIGKIFIPPHVTKIGIYAFCLSQNLSKVEIPENAELRIIERSTFESTMIDKISIPYHTKIISENAFNSCNNLEIVEFSINSELQYIRKNAFSACRNLKYIEIPENSELKSIERDAFNNTKIEKIYIPSKLVNLENGWWFGACHLRKIEISPLNTNFEFKDDHFFLGKTDPKSVNFDVLLFSVPDIVEANVPSNIKIISSYAFKDCTKLTKVDFAPDSELQLIEEHAFYNTKIEQMIIPSHVSNIDNIAFLSCEYLQIIQIEENSELKSIGPKNFLHCNFLLMIPSKNSIDVQNKGLIFFQ